MSFGVILTSFFSIFKWPVCTKILCYNLSVRSVYLIFCNYNSVFFLSEADFFCAVAMHACMQKNAFLPMKLRLDARSCAVPFTHSRLLRKEFDVIHVLFCVYRIKITFYTEDHSFPVRCTREGAESAGEIS